MRQVLVLILIWAGWQAQAMAEPSFARVYKGQYGYVPSCNACHKDGGGTPLNTYGEQFKDAGMKATAFAKISDLDADADGASNEAEAKAKSNPGGKGSTPENPGQWLDVANLIPKEVQVLFPGVRTYLPKDAILTQKEISRAKSMGVTLAAEDENTIYIPVQDKKAAGTAIIVPAVHQGKQFFLVVATDKSLAVSHVVPFNTKHVPEAENQSLYLDLIGKTAEKLPAGDGGKTLADTVNANVKKAVTLVTVRLKNE